MSLMLVWQSSLTSVKIGSCVCIIIVCLKVVCCVSCREAAYWRWALKPDGVMPVCALKYLQKKLWLGKFNL